MTTAYALTLSPGGQVITIARVAAVDNVWTIRDIGTTTHVIGRVFPIGRSTGTSGRSLTLDHIVFRTDGDYDTNHTSLEAITAYFQDANNPVAYATLTGPDSLSITVRITQVEFREPMAPWAALGFVRFTVEQVSN